MPNDADELTEPEIDEADAQVEADPGEAAQAESVGDPDTSGEADGYEAEDDFDYDDDEYEDDFDAAMFEDEPFLFEGDPSEYDLGFGLPEAHPTPGDVMVIDEPSHGPARARRPQRMSRAERRRRVRLQARRVRRIVRHIEPWSVLKISLLFMACLWVIFLVAGFMIWGVAESSGTVGKLESLIRDLFALDTFAFDAGQIFRGYALGGLALAIAGTTFNVLMCLLFNLISDLTGGLRITMIEEETARPMPPRRRRRRPQPQRQRR